MALLFAMLAAFSLAVTLWQWTVSRRFPLHRRVSVSRSLSAPPVTLLKPLKDCEPDADDCLRSWLTQHYHAPVQVLFGVADPDDPICETVRVLQRDFPDWDIQLIYCTHSLGPNAKVSTLCQLMPHAKYETLVLSDADVQVPHDFLIQILSPLEDSKVGLVNCFYALVNPTTPALRWEAVAINGDFWSQVLQAQSLHPPDYALGAAVATRKSIVKTIGGFKPLVHYLADDYWLGHEIAASGYRIALCPVPAQCKAPPMNWTEVWAHQLRWARTLRVCKPFPYFLSILGNPTAWPMLWWLAHPGLGAAAGCLLCLSVRVGTSLALQTRLTRSRDHQRYWWMVPVKDLLQAVLWILAFAGNTVDWRDQRYRVNWKGRLVKLEPPPPSPARSAEWR